MVELPSGTVTFLFTDLEASTRLWEEHPEAMPGALARHDEIVRAAIADHDGQIVKTTGDGFHAVFVDAALAVETAVDAQRQLGREPWGAPGGLRVRMGLHSGVAQWRGGDYPGLTVNKAARVMSVAHGGQVVVSLATAELMRDRLPRDVDLVGLGEHRLRDLSRAEQLFQVHAVGLRESFPPLVSLDALPNNLPVPLTRFVGRELEIVAVAKRLEESRLVTLTGAAGCGKTRLALQVGAEVLERFADGVWLVELAAVIDPALVPGAIASSLSVRESATTGVGLGGGGAGAAPARSLEDVVVEYLRRRRVLLILDNCEHLLDVCAPLVERLLLECAELRVLATSREPLGAEGEAIRRVPSLSLPDRTVRWSVEQVVECEAVELFLDRVALRVEGFAPAGDDLVKIGQICTRLDGIPLAIELAAARVKVLSPSDIALRLDNQFQLLTGGTRTSLERHQTLRAALDWSYDLLTEPEQLLLARLSVFAGSFSLEAVEAICTDDLVPRERVLDLLEHLADRSLVDTEPTAAGIRYRLLESIRQYGRDRLAESRDQNTWRRRHRDFFAEVATNAQRGLWGPDQGEWLTVVAADLENVRAAIDWSLADNDHEAALRIATALDAYWMGASTSAREGLRWLEECLTGGSDAPARLRARALTAISGLASRLGDRERAWDAGREALARYRDVSGARSLGALLAGLAMTARTLGRPADAESYSDEAVAVARQAGYVPTLGLALWIKSGIAFERGDFDTAYAACDEVLASRDQQVPGTVALALSVLGFIAFAESDYQAARRLFQEATDIESTTGVSFSREAEWGLAKSFVALGDYDAAHAIRAKALAWLPDAERPSEPEAFWSDLLAEIVLSEGDPDEAERLFRVALARFDNQSGPWLPEYLAAFASTALARSESERAVILISASGALREQLRIGAIALEWPPLSHAIASARNQLNDEAFADAWATGQSLSPEQAIGYALGTRPDPDRS